MPSFFEKLKRDLEQKDKTEKKEKLKAPSKEEWLKPEGQLAVDVFQTEKEIIIQSTIAGVGVEDLDISLENDVVTIRGERVSPPMEGEKKYFYQECYWGPFSRQIILPEEVDPDQIEAEMKNGILTIRLPKMDRHKKRKIKIKES